MDDRLQPIAVEAKGRYGDGFLRAIDAALAVRPQDRPQNEAQFRALLDIDLPAPPPSPPLSGYGALSHEPFPATQDSGYSTVPGTLTPGAGDAGAGARRRAAAAADRHRDAARRRSRRQRRQAPIRQMPAPRPCARRRSPGSTPPPSPRAAPQLAPAAAPRPAGSSAGSRTLVLGAAALLVVSGLAFGVYWTLQSRDDDAAKPTAPAASAVARAGLGCGRGSRFSERGRPHRPRTRRSRIPEVASAPISVGRAVRERHAAPATPAVAVEATKPVAIEPAAPASSPRREPAVVGIGAAPSAPRAGTDRAAGRVPPVADPAYPSAYPSAKGARCSDILQKGSLEPLTAEEAAYLKRECR